MRGGSDSIALDVSPSVPRFRLTDVMLEARFPSLTNIEEPPTLGTVVTIMAHFREIEGI